MLDKKVLHYKIIEKLGEGGMGIVYLAEDTKLDRKIAIKFLPHHISDNSDERKRFEIEAKAAAALNHPNIATIHAIEHANDDVFIVMEYIEGKELKQIIEEASGTRRQAPGAKTKDQGSSSAAHGQLPIADRQSSTENRLLTTDYCLDIATQIAEGLKAAHEKGIIHRDIKSSNIMITNDGKVKIMDFGLAKLGKGIQLTKEQSTLGTAPYMSPEQTRGENVDQRCDIWSFGVVFYEMLTNTLPYKGDYEQAVIYAILNEDPEPSDTLNVDIPQMLNQLLMHMLTKELEQRLASASDFLNELEQIKTTQSATVGSTAVSVLHILKKPKTLTVLILVLVVPTILIWFFFKAWQSDQELAALLPEITHAAETGNYGHAFELAQKAKKVLAHDSIFQALQPVISENFTILSVPAGSAVYLKPFRQLLERRSQAADEAGLTPLNKLSLARDDYLVRIEKEGYIPAIRIVTSNMDRQRNPKKGSYDIVLSVVLQSDSNITQNMVQVSGGKYRLVGAGAPTVQAVELDSFLIDKYEVTNGQFKEFILSGGYSSKSYWQNLFVRNSTSISWDDAMKIFKDRSGLPGPRSWINQEFPEGKENHPVTDISWYEAAAYAAYSGKRLPTIFEWEKAARNGVSTGFGSVMPWGLALPGQRIDLRANFNGNGTMPVDSFEFGISPYGCFNMGGNVKEWCVNQITGGYVATGGSWQDPVYLFAQYGAFDGFYSSPALGFRCVNRPAGSRNDQGTFDIKVDERTPQYHPVDKKTFKNLLSHYQYDKKLTSTELINTIETDDWVREKRTFAGPRGDRIISYLYLPKRIAEPYQCMIYVPGLGVFMGRNVTQGLESTIGPQIKSGRAALAVVLKGTTERDWEPDRTQPAPSSVQFREEMVLHATELRMGIDYLESRSDIDMKKLVYVGRSWGAGSRLGFAAVDDRFRAVLFIGGGIDDRVKPTLPEADNINFAPYIKPPKLMVNGKYDEEHSWYQRGLPLYNLLQEPKEYVLLEGGHMPSVELRTPVINKWLDKTLGPVNFK